jgi:glycosyltransferase involved in cell wall biosynthesis
MKMRQVIVQILQKCPRAYFVPIGDVRDVVQFMKYFSEKGVADRVKLLGFKQHPSQWARSMHVYLNEFPFGSCLGMLDAMAAGCAVVSMHDEDGPPQAKYAGNFLGIESVVTSGKEEDYIELACRLYEDKIFYQNSSEHSLKQFEKRSNIKQYVKDFEAILLSHLENTKE